MGADYEKAHRSVIGSGSYDVLAAGLTRYHGPLGGIFQLAEVDARQVIPFSCILTNLNVRSSGPPGGGEAYEYTIFVNGIGSALNLIIAGAAAVQAGPDLSMVVITAGDEISLQVIASGGAVGERHIWSLEVRN